jgi:hypothetical protein
MLAHWTRSHICRALLLEDHAHVDSLSGTKACLPRLSQINISRRPSLLEGKFPPPDFLYADIFEADFQDSEKCFMAVDPLEVDWRHTVQGVAEYHRLLSLNLWGKSIADVL